MRTRFNLEIEEQPDAIFCADLHVRDSVPSCRAPSFLEDMKTKIAWLAWVAFSLEVPVFGAGDVFDTWKLKDWWLAGTIFRHFRFPFGFYTVAGQHDLPRHSLELPERSPLNILALREIIHLLTPENPFKEVQCLKTNTDFHLYGRNFGAPVPIPQDDRTAKRILLTHELIWHRQKPYPQAPEEGNALKKLHRDYKQFDTVVSGDNHQPFKIRKDGRLLVNCGSMLRTSITQENHQPCVWLYYAKKNDAVPLYFPLRKGKAFEDYEYVESTEQDERIKQLVHKLGEGLKLKTNFVENLRQVFAAEKVPPAVQERILNAVE